MPQDFYYKVVAEMEDGTLKSCVLLSNVYRVGEPTVRNYGWGPLAVFPTLFHAASFVQETFCRETKIKIYRCIIEESADKELWNVGNAQHGTIDSRITARFLPEETVFADSVTLLEEVTGWW